MCDKTQRNRLFYDIETSFCQGSFWRPGFKQTIRPEQILKHAQIICISWKWEGEDQVHHLDWGLKKQCDKKLLKKFIKVLDKADEIVAHNGDRFDIKWIRARAAYHNLIMRPDYRSIDTLKLCKRYFNLPAYTLKHIAEYFELTHKLESGGLKNWIDVIVHKDKDALDNMLYYCDGDIITLEEVFHKIRPYIKASFNYPALRHEAKWRCPECGQLPVCNKSYTTTMGTIRRMMHCKHGCGQYFVISNKSYQDLLTFKLQNDIK